MKPALPETRPAQETAQGVIVARENIEIAKKGYDAYATGDAEAALSDFDDDVEWTIPGNSTVSGTYRGKDKFKELLGKLAEKSFSTKPERFIADGDDVVVITNITAGGESALQADVLTYRNGKVVEGSDLRGHCPTGKGLRQKVTDYRSL